jgi:primosomal protein N'
MFEEEKTIQEDDNCSEDIITYMDCHECGMVTDMHSRCEYCGADSAYNKEVD